MREQGHARQSRVSREHVWQRMGELTVEALNFIPQSRVAETVRQWLAHVSYSRDDADAADLLATALGLASDLALFMSSTSGSMAIDRLARHRQPADRAEKAAIEALRQVQFRVMRIEEREDRSTVLFRDLASGETLRIADESFPACCAGVRVTGRTAPLGDGTYALVSPVTPLDDDALAVALAFRRPDGKGLGGAQRCAEAVYRHVVRHGGPQLPGLNRPPESGHEDDEFPFGLENSALHGIAEDWARLDQGAVLPCDAVQQVRDLTSLPNMLDALAASALARDARRGRLADGYASIAAIQIETVRLREANGMSGLSLDGVSVALAHAIAKHGMPAAARELFESLQRQGRPATLRGAAEADLDRLIQRIQGLRAKTVEQGCTEQEALAAAEKVAELLDRYGLSLSAIELRRQACQGIGIDTGRRRLGPIDECVPSIAAFFDCRAWSEKPASATIRHVFFGLRADVEAAHYLYDLIERAFITETAVFGRGALYAELGSGERRSATTSFQIGLGRGIAAKLHSLRREREAGLRASGGELVPVKAALIDDELGKLGLHFRTQGRAAKKHVMTDAYEAGEAAGQRFEYRPGLAAAD